MRRLNKFFHKNPQSVVSSLIRNLISGDEDIADEAIAILCGKYKDSEITLYDTDENVIISTSTFNLDIKTEIAFIIACYHAIEDKKVLKRGSREKIRDNVECTYLFPLYCENRRVAILCIDGYGELNIEEDREWKDILSLLAISAWLLRQRRRQKVLLELDKATMLPMRDALVERMRQLVEDGTHNKCLGVISVSNLSELNQRLGVDTVDELIKRLSNEFSRRRRTDVYRIGGTKFAFIIQNDLYNAMRTMERLEAAACAVSEDIIPKTVLTPFCEEPYETIFFAERGIKNAVTDSVSVVRKTASDADLNAYEEIKSVHFSEVEPRRSEPIETVDVEVLSPQEVAEMHEENIPAVVAEPVNEEEEVVETGYSFDIFEKLMQEDVE